MCVRELFVCGSLNTEADDDEKIAIPSRRVSSLYTFLVPQELVTKQCLCCD